MKRRKFLRYLAGTPLLSQLSSVAIADPAMQTAPAITSKATSPDESPWFDKYYQYRLPVTFRTEHSGWQTVSLSELDITSAINELEEMQYDPLWFAYNSLRVVEVDASGRATHSDPVAGFYLVPESHELLYNGSFEGDRGTIPTGWSDAAPELKTFSVGGSHPKQPACLHIHSTTMDSHALVSRVIDPVEAGGYYLMSYEAVINSVGGNPVIELVGTLGGTATLSYQPFLWHREWTKEERLIRPDDFTAAKVQIATLMNGTADVAGLSLRKVGIVFLANVKEPGTKHWMIYYQPSNDVFLSMPQLRRGEIPTRSAQPVQIGSAQKYLGRTRYVVGSNDSSEAWFAETTVKLTPRTPPPLQKQEAIMVSGAQNEDQSFQIVLTPKNSFRFLGVEATPLLNGEHSIPSSNFSFYAVDYVPIIKSSPVTAAKYLGRIGDPLVAVGPKTVSPSDGNFALWITVKIPSGAAPGAYKGALTIKGAGKAWLRIPINLTVYDFALPTTPTFYSYFGGQAIHNNLSGYKTILDYHGLSTKDDLKKLSRQYYDLMCEQKAYPKTVLLYSEIGMKWSPPPEGYNVDKPDNDFKLYDWDFTEFNKDLKHYVEDVKVNRFAITHTNPSVCQMFNCLPGPPVERMITDAPHVSLAWQTFCEERFFGYDKREGDTYTEISVSQYDHLLLAFYRAVAENLEKRGWLDYVDILVDETWFRGFGQYLHFLKLLKSDPLTARIKIAWCVQNSTPYTYKENPDDKEYAFNDSLVDIFVPTIDERSNSWERFFFTEYGRELQPNRLRPYIVTTGRFAIDSPGVNNRNMPLEIFSMDGSGLVVWESFLWDFEGNKNPWKQPGTRWANGATSYFYPPSKEGPSPKPDWTIVPSLRLMSFRKGVDDYEYARILEKLVAEGKGKGSDVSVGEAVLKDIERFFYSSVLRSQNDAWYLELREKMANAIVSLKQ